jgi:hypothetical protein
MGEPSTKPRSGGALPCIAVTGESRSGKSSLINALLGASVLPTGLGDQVRPAVLISYASKPSLAAEHNNHRRVAADWATAARIPFHSIRRLRLGLPNDLLKSTRLVETPGFATGCEEVEQRAFEACRRVDAGIWCTPAMQAWKASERDAWVSLSKRIRARSILAITYMDAIRSQTDRERLSARILAEAAAHFGNVVMIASKDATSARELDPPDGNEELWHASGGADLCAAVRALIATPSQLAGPWRLR